MLEVKYRGRVRGLGLRRSSRLLALSVALGLGSVVLRVPTFFVPDAYSEEIPAELKDAQIKENLGAKISGDDLQFVDEAGKARSFSEFFDGTTPVVVHLVYYGCPNLCTWSLNGLIETIGKADFIPGKDYRVLILSVDPKESPALAQEKRTNYLSELETQKAPASVLAGARQDLRFLTGTEPRIRALADRLGFGYRWDPLSKQYAHSAGVFFLSGQGVLSRALKGITYTPRDFRFALLEAGRGNIGTVVDQLVMFCFRYDPTTHRYALYAMRTIQIGSVLMVILMGAFFLPFWIRQRRTVTSSAK